MAGATSTTILSTLLLLFSAAISLPAANSQDFSTALSKREMGLKKENLSHLHFYFHDTLSGRNPTAVPVAKAATTNTSATVFGLVMVTDDPLTVALVFLPLLSQARTVWFDRKTKDAVVEYNVYVLHY